MRLWLTSLAIFAEFLAIVTASSLRGRRDSPTSLQDSTYEAGNDVCVKPECYDIASRIKQSMKLEINPCDDFYQYTCGNFATNATSITEKEIKRNFEFFELQINLQLKSLFESDDEPDDIKPFKEAKTLYKSCINEEAIESKADSRQLKQFIRKFGGWPVVEGQSWNESNFDWMGTIADWNRAGLQPNCFINFRMQKDNYSTSQRTIYLIPAQFFEMDIFKKSLNDSIMALHALKVDIAESLGVDRKSAEEELMEVLQFRFRLNKVISASTGKGKALRITLNELIEHYPSVDWRNILARMYSPMQTIAGTDIIVVTDPTFIDQVIRLVSTTPKRVQANFAMFQLIEEVMFVMDRAASDIWKKHVPVSSVTPRLKQCNELMKTQLPSIVRAMYMKKLLTPKRKRYVEDLLRKIQQEFRANLDEVSFLDNETRASAKENERAIKHIIGEDDLTKHVLTDDNLNDYYRDLEFVDNEYMTNYLRLMKFKYETRIANISKPLEKIEAKSILHRYESVLPFSHFDSNAIEIPAHILQGIMFDLERPDYMNFATLGIMLGDEVTKLFSNSRYVYLLSRTRRNWWTTTAKQAFDNRTNCFDDQYTNYFIGNNGNPVSVSFTRENIIADNAGVKMAYRAYANKMRGKVPEKRLPGLDKSPNQMFWIAYVNMYCEKINDLSWSYNLFDGTISTISHPRITAALWNSEEFAKDFDCPLGSKMNPIKKCSAW